MIKAVRLFFFFVLFSCNNERKTGTKETAALVIESQPNLYYGIDLNNFELQEKKIRRGDTFGKILEENGIDYPEVYSILLAIKGKVNVRKLNVGKPYSLFYSKDSLTTPEYFIYHPDVSAFSVIHLRDSLYGKEVIKPTRTVELEASGIIESSLYETMKNSGINES